MPFRFRTLILASCCSVTIACFAEQATSPPAEREQQLLDRIAKLEERLSVLEKKLASPAAAPEPAAVAPTPAPVAPAPTEVASRESGASSWLQDSTLNVYFDGYYMWNTNRPLGRVNLSRAYDVTANSFSINQTGIVFEKTPNPAAGRRWGYRLDLMYGQATETLQGGAQNEPRPQVYRPVYQAYGTYVVPAGKGLTVDFGKWASTLGGEGNYTKDQINYSRSYFFYFLPFYHMGFRTTYPVNDKLSLSYWLVNGANQTEDFNEFKSQLAQAIIKPSKSIAWTVQYYTGQEQRDLVPLLNPGIPAILSQPGLSTAGIVPAPRGRSHAIDTYAWWSLTDRLTLGGEIDYVISRVQSNSAPRRVTGGAAYLRYQLTPKLYFGQRYTRLNDDAGLFSGVSQNLNDLTSTFGIRMADGFETRLEYRRDFSNVPFFFSSDPARLMKDQNTFTLGLLWWFGGKQGAW